MCQPKRQIGFTLAELLIALAILGVIATFSIPKILLAQQASAWNSEAKEAASAVSQAYTLYQKSNTPSTTTGADDLIAYFNYVRADTSSLIDLTPGSTSLNCGGHPTPCLVLHNGSFLASGGTTFGQTNTTNYIHFLFDPDGQYSGNTTGPGKSITIDLYFNGRVTAGTERLAGDVTYQSGAPQSWGPDTAPEWWQSWK